MTFYAEIVHADDIEHHNGTAVIDSDDATLYKPLLSIAYPAGGGNLDWTETVVLTHEDGSVETVDGYVVSSGEVVDE